MFRRLDPNRTMPTYVPIHSDRSSIQSDGSVNDDLPPAEQELIEAAVNVRANAYAPYSRFLVGAALLTNDGKVVTGVNVENASYGLTMCAERVAVGAAVAAGHRQFSAIAIASRGGVSPCGACRQVLAQFGIDLDIWLVDADDVHGLRRSSLRSLLPDAFAFDPTGT